MKKKVSRAFKTPKSQESYSHVLQLPLPLAGLPELAFSDRNFNGTENSENHAKNEKW